MSECAGLETEASDDLMATNASRNGVDRMLFLGYDDWKYGGFPVLYVWCWGSPCESALLPSYVV